MKQEQHEKIFFNRADVENAERIHCENKRQQWLNDIANEMI